MTETKTTAKKPKRNRRPAAYRTPLGDHGQVVLGVLYRMGGATPQQLGGWLDLLLPDEFGEGAEQRSRAALGAARKSLAYLRRARLVEALGIRREWLGRRNGRHEDLWRLADRKRNGEGIVMGAIAAGEDGAQGKANYRRFWTGVGGSPEHCAQKADYVLLFLEEVAAENAGAKREVVSLDVLSIWGESYRAFPWVGAKRDPVDEAGAKLDLKKNSRKRYERKLVPDARFELGLPAEGLDPAEFVVEMERRTNAGEVMKKLQRFCGKWLRELRDHGTCTISPTLILHHDDRPANPREGSGAPSMSRRLAALLSGNEGGHYARLQEALRERDPGADLGRLIVVADWREVYMRGPLSPSYYPLGGYAPGVGDDAGRVDLLAVARERAALAAAVEGQFDLSWPEEGAACPYVLKVARGNKDVEGPAAEVEHFAEGWLGELTGTGRCAVSPVVVAVAAGRRGEEVSAHQYRRALYERLNAGNARGSYARLHAALRERDPEADLGRLVLVADWGELRADGALARAYPVGQYGEDQGDDGGWTVDLYAAAKERAALVAVVEAEGGEG